jgi:2-methylcitrate dehydratase
MHPIPDPSGHPTSGHATYLRLDRQSNQARGLALYARDFLAGHWPDPDDSVFERTEWFHRDSVACGLAALGLLTNAPRCLRAEAADYPRDSGAVCLGSSRPVAVEKAIVANCAAVRELDANGTNFGFNPRTGDCRGEFGHNDFYPVAVAAAALAGWDGRQLVKAMICLDEIRGRLAEVFALRDHKIDHVVHGAIASAAVYGAARGATVGQIESAIGLLVAHYIPFRAIRAGHQLSDSKGASAAITTEMAILSVHRALRGFIGPADIFRNPQALFCLFEPSPEPDTSPFDLELATHGDDFAVMGMHFKLGLYEHQSAGAIQGLLDLLARHPGLLENESELDRIRIVIYEPAYSIIGDPAKRDPRTRQSADHSMVYIIATLLRKALESRRSGWSELMLLPADYDDSSLFHPVTRRLMERIEFVHGGAEFDRDYPEGIPTTVEVRTPGGPWLSSGKIRFPLGHARCEDPRLEAVLGDKFQRLASLGVCDVKALEARLSRLREQSVDQVRQLYQFELRSNAGDGEDGREIPA